MDKTQYPALADTGIVHLDVSAVFPLHREVISAVDAVMLSPPGAPSKGQYTGSMSAAQVVDTVRQAVASLIHADASEVFFVASATDAARILADIWGDGRSLLYSPEDHDRIVHEFVKQSQSRSAISYGIDGEYDYNALVGSQPEVAVLSHIHHVYGSDSDMSKVRQLLPDTKFIIDASQSISRRAVNIRQIGCDALFFSAQKIGGLAGVGVLYIAQQHHVSISRNYIEPNTLPVVPLASLGVAVNILERETLASIEAHLAKMTSYSIDMLHTLPTVTFSKGPAYPDYRCAGNGIVSFSVEGYTSHDVAMILADEGIQVRAGDHCVDPNEVDQDVVRISLHRYTTVEDIDRLVSIIARL